MSHSWECYVFLVLAVSGWGFSAWEARRGYKFLLALLPPREESKR